jgi:putative hydrolase of the HAD superfamily
MVKNIDHRKSVHGFTRQTSHIRALFLDFGGVLAEEGFREGLMAAARAEGLDPNWFFSVASDLAYDSGYVRGAVDESEYWNLLRRVTGITLTDDRLRSELLTRFSLRPRMLDLARNARAVVGFVGILSDQTNWLDMLEEQFRFFQFFDKVFNSYHLGKTKKDVTIFTDITREIGVSPEATLFIDDNPGHIERAGSAGWNACLYTDEKRLVSDLQEFGLGGLSSFAALDS